MQCDPPKMPAVGLGVPTFGSDVPSSNIHLGICVSTPRGNLCLLWEILGLQSLALDDARIQAACATWAGSSYHPVLDLLAGKC